MEARSDRVSAMDQAVNSISISDRAIVQPLGLSLHQRLTQFLHRVLIVVGFCCIGSTALAVELFPPLYDLDALLPVNGGDGTDGFVIDDVDELFKIDPVAVSENIVSGLDWNGDGVGDLVVSVRPSIGAFLVFGSPSLNLPEINLNDLTSNGGADGPAGVLFKSSGFSNAFDVHVSSAGDLNADGIEDLSIAFFDFNSRSTIYVVFGKAQSAAAEFELNNLLVENGGDGSEGFVIFGTDRGPGTFDGFPSAGRSMASVGDINADGLDDLVIGAPGGISGVHNTVSRVFVVYGNAAGFDAELNLEDLRAVNGGDGSVGTSFNEITTQSSVGYTVGAAGDINADGINDFIIGDPFSRLNGDLTGFALVVYGSPSGFGAEFALSNILGEPDGGVSVGFVATGSTNVNGFGLSLAGGEDINGDGVDDILIGTQVNRAYVIFGSAEGFESQFSANDIVVNDIGIELWEPNPHQFGRSVSIGDVNGDGSSDILASSAGFGLVPGAAYAVFGQSNLAPILDVSLLEDGTGENGLKIERATPVQPYLIRTVGDINGDTADDMMVVSGTQPNVSAHVLFGRNEGSADFDGDGLSNANDNCVSQANAQQIDDDGDGIGNRCDTDYNNDCVVNFADLSAFGAEFLGMDPLFDTNNDGFANFFDFNVLTSFFLNPPGPSGVANICE